MKFLLVWAAIWSVFGYLVSRVTRRNDVADALWGLGFVLGGSGYWFFLNPQVTERSCISLALLSVWGLRLSIHLATRMAPKPEDFRYANWRRDWGKTEPWRAFLQVFVLQALILCVLLVPWLCQIEYAHVPIGLASWAGLSLFVAGLGVEWLADAQLRHHKKTQAKNAVLNDGLWASVRHPNYLGEILMAWGVFLSALETPAGLYALAAPVLLTFLLVRVSGVPMLDSVLSKRSAAHAAYIRSTPALVPRFAGPAIQFLAIGFTLAALDALWLGFIMKPYYSAVLAEVAARTPSGDWNAYWPAVPPVYIALALGIQVFATRPAQMRTEAVFRAALFGFCTYAVYEFTNRALLKGWPSTVVAVDLFWGTALCAAAAAICYRPSSRP